MCQPILFIQKCIYPFSIFVIFFISFKFRLWTLKVKWIYWFQLIEVNFHWITTHTQSVKWLQRNCRIDFNWVFNVLYIVHCAHFNKNEMEILTIHIFLFVNDKIKEKDLNLYAYVAYVLHMDRYIGKFCGGDDSQWTQPKAQSR